MSIQPAHHTFRRSRRPKGVTAFDAADSWTYYLEEEGSAVDPRLCHVLASFALRVKNATPESATSESDWSDREEQVGFPWVTPVVGSGCLGQPAADQVRELLHAPSRMAATVRDQEYRGGIRAADVVYPFTKSLLRQRVQELENKEFASSESGVAEQYEPSDIDIVVANCLVAAALVMRAWHEAGAISGDVIRQRDTLSLPASDPRSAEVEAALLAPAAECLRRARRVLKLLPRGNPLLMMSTVVERLSSRVENHLKRDTPRITGHDVDGLVEVAWLMLITPVGIYPGWRDLMAAAALQSSLQNAADGAERAIDFSRPRPALRDVGEAAKVAASVASLESATQYSWVERSAGTPSARIDFYDALADLLIAQLSYGDQSSPIPAAFVTSMDLELEMSLVRQKKRFTVLVPYHFAFGKRNSKDLRSMLFWLAVTVDASAVDLDEPFNLKDLVVGWRDAPGALDRLRDELVIVRLVGSPLMPIATGGEPLFDARTGKNIRGTKNTLLKRLGKLAATATGQNPESFDIRYGAQIMLPAFMLDEYSAMHHLAAGVHGSLPSNLVNIEPDWIYRFWLATGVQLDDILVRLLVASHVDTGSELREMLDHHGVMVNPYVSKAEVDLLAWQGLDVVRAGFESVTPDLRHYAAHMRYRIPEDEDPMSSEERSSTTRDPELTFVADGECPVTGGQA